MNYPKISLAIATSLALTACGSGGGSSSSDEEKEPEQPEVSITNGGPISNPTPIDFYNRNSILNEDFNNHYQVSVSAGDSLIISSMLNGVIGETDGRRCIEREEYYTGIRLLDAPEGTSDYDRRSCSSYFYHSFEEAGIYTVKLGFPNLSGTFIATLLPANTAPTIGSNEAEGGLPDSLGRISLSEKNTLSSHPATNHFGYEGNAGETIYLQAYIDPAEGSTTERRCKEFSRHFDGQYAFGWAVMSEKSPGNYGFKPDFNCSHNLEYTFPEDGTYHFNFRSFVGGDGYFYATTTTTPL